MTGARVLYLTYDGLTDPLGQSQVLPYLEGLAARGHRITVLSAEKSEAFVRGREVIEGQCRAAAIEWIPLPYRKRPPILSTVADLTAMARAATRLHEEKPFDIVHCRSYLTGLIGRTMQRRAGVKFLFDMRGFWIDERFERGIWNERSPAYRLVASWFRRRERDMFEHADAIVSLTTAARDELKRKGGHAWAAKTQVVPCCVDLARFDPRGSEARARGRNLLGLDPDVPVLLFLGSLGGAYPLAPVAQFFRAWARGRPDARLLFVTRHSPDELIADAAIKGLWDRIIVRAAERDDVPSLVAAADAGLSFILPSYCAIASSPTKVGEMLAMGVPVAANAGVGDMTTILADRNAGVVLRDLDESSIANAASAMLQLQSNCAAARALAERWYSLEGGVNLYASIYQSLAVH